jgi:tRNA (guanine-N7-)-methyltransferase
MSPIYELRSIVQRLDLSCIFPSLQPLEVELGSGDGSFLVEQARRLPRRNFLGVERLLGRLHKMERKIRRASLSNVRGIRVESGYFLKYLLPPRAAAALHVYFPDPWPKRRHRHHRLVSEEFATLAHAALGPQGRVYFRTDDPDYFAWIRDVFGSNRLFREVSTPAELEAVATDFERDFQAQGVPILRAAYEKLDIDDGAAAVRTAAAGASSLKMHPGAARPGQSIEDQ